MIDFFHSVGPRKVRKSRLDWKAGRRKLGKSRLDWKAGRGEMRKSRLDWEAGRRVNKAQHPFHLVTHQLVTLAK